jgi:hypothetical protein
LLGRFWQLDNSQAAARNRVSVLFLAAVFCGMVSVSIIPKIVGSRATVFRETTSNTYRKVRVWQLSYLLSTWCCVNVVLQRACVSIRSRPRLLLLHMYCCGGGDVESRSVCIPCFLSRNLRFLSRNLRPLHASPTHLPPPLLGCLGHSPTQMPYYFAVVIADIPFQVVASALFVVPFYFMAGFRLWGPLFNFCVCFFEVMLVTHAFAQLLAFLAPNTDSATIFTMLANSVFTLFCGFMLPYASIPVYWRYDVCLPACAGWMKAAMGLGWSCCAGRS